MTEMFWARPFSAAKCRGDILALFMSNTLDPFAIKSSSGPGDSQHAA